MATHWPCAKGRCCSAEYDTRATRVTQSATHKQSLKIWGTVEKLSQPRCKAPRIQSPLLRAEVGRDRQDMGRRLEGQGIMVRVPCELPLCFHSPNICFPSPTRTVLSRLDFLQARFLTSDTKLLDAALSDVCRCGGHITNLSLPHVFPPLPRED